MERWTGLVRHPATCRAHSKRLHSKQEASNGGARLVPLYGGGRRSGKVSGAWVFRGTRMPVVAVFENLEDGMSIDEIVRLYDGLTREQVQSVLEFAARSLETPATAG